MKYAPIVAVVILVFGFSAQESRAQLLPSMHEKPWLGFLSGYERRDFHFGVNNEGQCELHLMKSRKERASYQKKVKIYAELVVEAEDGKRSYKRLKDDEGFATTLKPGLEHEEVTFTAETLGDAKVEVHIKYDGDRIIFDGKVLDRGKLKKGKLYFGYKVLMPEFYRSSTYGKDKGKAKAKMRRDDFKFTRAKDGKKKSLKVYEEYDLEDEEVAGGGITKLEVDMSAQEGKEFIFSTTDGKGVFELTNRSRGKKSEPWRGYYVKWYRPMEEEKGKEIKPFVLEVK